MADDLVAETRVRALDAVSRLELVPISADVIQRAAEPFPILIGSLDAIHLATALIVRDTDSDMTFATHDRELAVAARSVGFSLAE
jgi:predicted nucleic acid-binding protein